MQAEIFYYRIIFKGSVNAIDRRQDFIQGHAVTVRYSDIACKRLSITSHLSVDLQYTLCKQAAAAWVITEL